MKPVDRDYRSLFDRLSELEVEFAIVRGVALVLRGSAKATFDIDLCYGRSRRNLKQLAEALRPFAPTLRGAPADLPFQLDAETLHSGLNFTLNTTIGPVDLLGEITGLGTYAVVVRLSSELDIYGHRVKVLTLEGLERAKRAAGRGKDLIDLAEIREIRRQTGE